MSSGQTKLPRLRAVDVMQVRGSDGEPYLVLRDSMQIADQPLAISAAGYLALAHLDGHHTVEDVRRAYREQLGVDLPAEQIHGLVTRLEDALFLEGGRFDQAAVARVEAYRAAAARDNRERYPETDALRAELAAILKRGSVAPTGPVRGLIAPHLDYDRGAPAYADAYATLAAAGLAERYVILGTNHAGHNAAVVATSKDFQTPLGRVPTDRDFLARLEGVYGAPLCEHEYEHVPEHSVELQVHLLQMVHDAAPPATADDSGAGAQAPKPCSAERPFSIVPILCGSPCGVPLADGTDPAAKLRQFGDALATVIAESAKRTVIIAGADLSHVGQHFGDADPTTPAFLAQVGDGDRGLLQLLEARREDEFITRLQEDENPTRICSAGCVYALLRALRDAPCRLLTYHQAVDMESEMHVTCAAAVVG